MYCSGLLSKFQPRRTNSLASSTKTQRYEGKDGRTDVLKFITQIQCNELSLQSTLEINFSGHGPEECQNNEVEIM